jgi:hypothetical protein
MGECQLSINVGKYPVEFGQSIELGLLIGGKFQILSAVEKVFQPLLGGSSKLKHGQAFLLLHLEMFSQEP